MFPAITAGRIHCTTSSGRGTTYVFQQQDEKKGELSCYDIIYVPVCLGTITSHRTIQYSKYDNYSYNTAICKNLHLIATFRPSSGIWSHDVDDKHVTKIGRW